VGKGACAKVVGTLRFAHPTIRVFSLRAKSNLLKRINVIWGVQIARKKYFLSRLRPNQIIIRPSRLPEGRFAIVTDVRRDAVDAYSAFDERC
jgi:hypothetical protein